VMQICKSAVRSRIYLKDDAWPSVIEVREEAWRNALTQARKVAEEKPKAEAAAQPRAPPGREKPAKPCPLLTSPRLLLAAVSTAREREPGCTAHPRFRDLCPARLDTPGWPLPRVPALPGRPRD